MVLPKCNRAISLGPETSGFNPESKMHETPPGVAHHQLSTYTFFFSTYTSSSYLWFRLLSIPWAFQLFSRPISAWEYRGVGDKWRD